MSKTHEWQNNHLRLFCHIQSNASKNEFTGIHNDRIKIRIKAQAIEGKANNEIIKFLAKTFSTSKSQVTIEKGLNNKYKSIIIKAPFILPKDLKTIIASPILQ